MNRNIKRSFLFLAASIVVLAFQNCARTNFTSVQSPTDLSSTTQQGGAQPQGSSSSDQSGNSNQGSGGDDAAVASNPTPSPSPNDPAPSPSPVVMTTPTPAPTATPVCKTDYVDVSHKVKILFLVDTSGSNATTKTTIGTDNNKVWRLATINNFVNAYSSKSNFYFGLVTFQGSSATPQIASGGNGIFTNDPSAVQQGITNFKNTADSGSTPYQPAILMAKSMISADLKAYPSSDTAYVIVMISDGEPKDAVYLDPSTGIRTLISDVASVISVATSQISFNTVYLYNSAAPSNSNTTYLQTIANAGGGVFVQANSQSTLSIKDTVEVPQQVCQ